MKGVKKQCQAETEQARWVRDQRQEERWVTARAVIARVIRQEFLQERAGVPAAAPESVWAAVQAVEQVGVSGAGESPGSEELEDLLPGVTTRDTTTLHLLRPVPNRKLISLKIRSYP